VLMRNQRPWPRLLIRSFVARVDWRWGSWAGLRPYNMVVAFRTSLAIFAADS